MCRCRWAWAAGHWPKPPRVHVLGLAYMGMPEDPHRNVPQLPRDARTTARQPYPITFSPPQVIDELAAAAGIDCRKLEKSAAVGKGELQGKQVWRRAGAGP